MTIEGFLKETTSEIERRLDNLISEKKESKHANLFLAARYSLLGGGKRLRPVLTLAVAKAFGGSTTKALTPACAIEMVHTYSLIHDDLPCMDNDDFRRGKPSLHKAYGEGPAVLTGDFLLTYAFDVIAEDPEITPRQKVELISLLAKASGGDGMIGGQLMDIESEGKAIALESLEQIHRFKTGAMITAAILAGGIIAEVKENDLAKLKQFSEYLGLAYQVVDDILDITASEKKHGKKTSSDQIRGKTTYVTLLGLDKAQSFADNLLKEALNTLDSIPQKTEHLAEIATMLVKREL